MKFPSRYLEQSSTLKVRVSDFSYSCSVSKSEHFEV